MAKTIRIHLSPAVLAVTSVAIAGAVGAAIWLAGMAQDCHARWKDSGLRVEFRDWQCLVEASGRIYPEHVIRIHVREPG